MALGADGIYMGTRIIASKESPVKEEYKKSILGAGVEDIVNTDRVDGFPGNFINTAPVTNLVKSSFVENILNSNAKVKRWVSLARAGKILFGAENQKLSYKNVFSAGHGVGLIDSIMSIEEIFYKTMNEYHELVQKMPR